MMPFGQKLATRGAESSLAVRRFMIPVPIETDETCSMLLDAGIADFSGTPRFMTGRCGPEANTGRRDVEKRSLRLTREGDRSDTSG